MNKIRYIEKNIRIGVVTVKKYKRNERIGVISRMLVDAPNKIFTLNCFTELFNSAKSTISEDLMIIKTIFEENELGIIETITGAAGGVKFTPHFNKDQQHTILEEVRALLSKTSRIVPGGYVFMSDVLSNPKYIKPLSEIFATRFNQETIDYVVTVETSGIPLATLTAHALNVPLVIFRNDNKVADGSTISIHYVSGSTGRLQQMYVSKRAIAQNSNILIIDDFMKAGGTAKGMIDLVKEFDSKVVGIGVLVESDAPHEKLVDNYQSLITLNNISGYNDLEIVISDY